MKMGLVKGGAVNATLILRFLRAEKLAPRRKMPGEESLRAKLYAGRKDGFHMMLACEESRTLYARVQSLCSQRTTYNNVFLGYVDDLGPMKN
jgi:hypothetical protein